MNSNAARNALVAVLSALIGVLLLAAGFLAAVIVFDEGDEVAAPAAVAEVTATPVADPTETPESASIEDGGTIHSGIFEEIIDILEEDFVDPDRIDRQYLFEGAIGGIFTALNDPHSTYIDPRTFQVSRGDFRGAFQGIGATIAQQDNYVVIVRPLPGTPAERAGIQPGDVILEVDGESAEGWSVEKAVLRIRGRTGTTVELLVRHSDGSEELIPITRDEILVASVGTAPPGGVLKDSDDNEVTDLAYIRISTFTARTPTELRQAIEAAGDVKGLVLDVRSNPGGLLVETAQVADMFLDGGTILVQVDRDGNEQVYDAQPGAFTDLPIAILQDEFSASGSELLAAALQENGRAIVVGANSFGKGTVSHARDLSNGGAVYVSIARWLTPDRNLIEGRGVIPDIEVELTVEDIEERRDVALFRAIDALRAQVESQSSASS
ncbi:MAG: S41 family peptidase [Chloroflexi bacterium]|nr:S41 family peptidase [Chloroflexota bacterium]